jgi:hypothetical protein
VAPFEYGSLEQGKKEESKQEGASEGANMNFANKNVFFFSGKLVETS